MNNYFDHLYHVVNMSAFADKHNLGRDRFKKGEMNFLKTLYRNQHFGGDVFNGFNKADVVANAHQVLGNICIFIKDDSLYNFLETGITFTNQDYSNRNYITEQLMRLMALSSYLDNDTDDANLSSNDREFLTALCMDMTYAIGEMYSLYIRKPTKPSLSLTF